MTPRVPTIGVFDSGVGGLTVLGALLTQASAADYLYLGDTARLPYGSKSQATVARYAVSSAHFLVEQGAEALVIACNTASALALDALRAAVEVPVYVDADTGFGGVNNVRQMVRAFEAAGVAGLFISDQVFPNRCGYLPGKQIVPVEQMLSKVKAALDPGGVLNPGRFVGRI